MTSSAIYTDGENELKELSEEDIDEMERSTTKERIMKDIMEDNPMDSLNSYIQKKKEENQPRIFG